MGPGLGVCGPDREMVWRMKVATDPVSVVCSLQSPGPVPRLPFLCPGSAALSSGQNEPYLGGLLFPAQEELLSPSLVPRVL